jgi:hypothetical protein
MCISALLVVCRPSRSSRSFIQCLSFQCLVRLNLTEVSSRASHFFNFPLRMCSQLWWRHRAKWRGTRHMTAAWGGVSRKSVSFNVSYQSAEASSVLSVKLCVRGVSDGRAGAHPRSENDSYFRNVGKLWRMCSCRHGTGPVLVYFVFAIIECINANRKEHTKRKR